MNERCGLEQVPLLLACHAARSELVQFLIHQGHQAFERLFFPGFPGAK
jgi:hypothetical protein